MTTTSTPHPAYARVVDFAARAETRGLDEGHLARVQADGSFLVRSHRDTRSYRVTFWGDAHTNLVRFACECPSGENRRHLPCPCKHSTRVARRLVREGIAVRRNGLFYIAPHLTPAPAVPVPDESDDPFAGIEDMYVSGASS